MSEDLLAPLVTVAILAALILWVPTLHICGAGCQKLLGRRRASVREEALAREESAPSFEQVHTS